MVDLTTNDFNEILSWFTVKFGKFNPMDIPKQSYKTFWKLTFLCEDRLEEEKDKLREDES
tara:strand:- start:1395 stop:1574 length:180 start_codon:yes stop_codon:yes gene_type:complete